MSHTRYLFFILIFFLCSVSAMAGATIPNANVYIISIGINEYSSPWGSLKNCVSDATVFADKIMADVNKHNKEVLMQTTNTTRSLAGSSPSLPLSNSKQLIDSVYTYLLLNENATKSNIEDVLKKTAYDAGPEDIFIFYFGGISWEDSSSLTYLVPYLEETVSGQVRMEKCLALKNLANIMEQIACEKQLIISEAGSGADFSRNLIAAFFESNPWLSTSTSRDRYILTTTGLGLDNLSCQGQNYEQGPLMHYLLASTIFDIFYRNYSFQFQLMKQDLACFGEKKYVAYYSEKEYQNIYVQSQNPKNRGVDVEDTEAPETTKEAPKLYALVVGTNWYSAESKWTNLKNPINDASAIAKLLKQNYGALLTQLENPTKNQLLQRINEHKNKMNEQDKFILFIAGHGYFSNEISDGALVTADSKSLTDDPFLESYLQMASLHRMVDALPAHNVFVVFDVCFGATFDLNAPSVDPNRYTSLERDISLEEFITRQNEKKSRIFLASGRYTVPDYWNTSLNHSPFAEKLITALAIEKEFISPGILLSHLEGNATAPILKQFGRHEAGADFLIAKQ